MFIFLHGDKIDCSEINPQSANAKANEPIAQTKIGDNWKLHHQVPSEIFILPWPSPVRYLLKLVQSAIVFETDNATINNHLWKTVKSVNLKFNIATPVKIIIGANKYRGWSKLPTAIPD